LLYINPLHNNKKELGITLLKVSFFRRSIFTLKMKVFARFTVLALLIALAGACDIPLNCGEHNSTKVCNHSFTGCDVCDTW
jgi:hypothetical protein